MVRQVKKVKMLLSAIQNKNRRRKVEERLVLSIGNAIRNPLTDVAAIQRLLVKLKDAGCKTLAFDIDHWIALTIKYGNLEIFLEIIGKRCFAHDTPKEAFIMYVVRIAGQHIPSLLRASWINTKDPSFGKLLVRLIHHSEFVAIENYFMQEGTVYWLENWPCQDIPARFVQNGWRIYNPDLIKIRTARVILMRFWIFQVRRNIRLWKERLYEPGYGALYLKAVRTWNLSIAF